MMTMTRRNSPGAPKGLELFISLALLAVFVVTFGIFPIVLTLSLSAFHHKHWISSRRWSYQNGWISRIAYPFFGSFLPAGIITAIIVPPLELNSDVSTPVFWAAFVVVFISWQAWIFMTFHQLRDQWIDNCDFDPLTIVDARRLGIPLENWQVPR
jgi:hypothetical protein